jgi:uncharacterized protein (TIGR04141 family)
MAPKAKVPGSASTMTLSLRLLREGKSVEDAVRDGSGLVETDATGGRLFTDQSVATAPGWLSLVNQFATDPKPKLENKSCAAVLFLDVTPTGKGTVKRTFALAFGGGHHGLDQEAIERNFGLKVALNSIARQDLRNLDVATLESTSFQKRIQSSRKADLQGFGIDVQRELLRLAGGVPADTSFAKSLSGKDALTITAKVAAADIADKCLQALQLFGGTDYKKDYAFIDLITPVRDRTLIGELDDLIFAEIKTLLGGKPSDLHITLPEVIDPEATHDIGYFGVGFRSGTKTGYAELAIEDYVAELKAGHPTELRTIEDVKSGHEVRVVVDGQGEKEKKRRIYDCFVYETAYKTQIYVLFSGEWYCVEDKFFKAVDADFQSLLSATPVIASTTAKNEQELIAELDKDPDLLNLDRVKASPSGAAGANLEPCDFFSRKKEFIHLKDGHGSAPISHLWNQGLVSAESFVRDEVFRKSMRASAVTRQKASGKAGFETLLPDGRSKPTIAEYKVVYGIMRHRYRASKTLGLPFFSKVSLRAAASRIQLMGYPVEVHLIEKT